MYSVIYLEVLRVNHEQQDMGRHRISRRLTQIQAGDGCSNGNYEGEVRPEAQGNGSQTDLDFPRCKKIPLLLR